MRHSFFREIPDGFVFFRKGDIVDGGSNRKPFGFRKKETLCRNVSNGFRRPGTDFSFTGVAYSQAARGEWVMNRERIPLEEYRNRYVKQFKAEHYDPADWMKKAVRWGMKYAVLTTRHHDGFALWIRKSTLSTR